MRLVWFNLIVSFVLFVWIGETMPGISWLAFPNAGKTFVILAVFDIVSLFWSWRKRYSPALGAVRSQPKDIDAVRSWKGSWTVLVCMANAEIAFGFAFRMGGKTLQQTLPFYVFGALVFLWLWPRPVWSSPK
jgi:hypothetical protein